MAKVKKLAFIAGFELLHDSAQERKLLVEMEIADPKNLAGPATCRIVLVGEWDIRSVP